MSHPCHHLPISSLSRLHEVTGLDSFQEVVGQKQSQQRTSKAQSHQGASVIGSFHPSICGHDLTSGTYPWSDDKLHSKNHLATWW